MLRRFAIVTFAALFFIPSLCQGAERFLLETELHHNYSAADSTEFLTRYTYDANGNRVLSQTWSGSDTMTELMSRVIFTYNSSGDCIRELVLSGCDTVTIVLYVYSNRKLLSVHTLRKDGMLRFTDSLLYDDRGRNVEERRISPAGVVTFFHRYTLDTEGKMLADTLFELVAGSYMASQAVIVTCSAELTVVKEAKWRLSGVDWYCMSTSFMHYAATCLSSVVTFERDGMGTGMIDSIAYTYDEFGNRTSDAAYDGEGALLHSVVYAWRDMRTSIALTGGNTSDSQRFIVNGINGRLTVDRIPRDGGMLTLYTIAGKLICRVAVQHPGVVPLHELTGNGWYVAVFTHKTERQVITFNNYN